MQRIDLQLVEFNRGSKHGIYTDAFIPTNAELPLGYNYRYYLRGSDRDSAWPGAAEVGVVRVNFCGTLFTAAPLKFKKDHDFLPIVGFYTQGTWRACYYTKRGRTAEAKTNLIYNSEVFNVPDEPRRAQRVRRKSSR